MGNARKIYSNCGFDWIASYSMKKAIIIGASSGIGKDLAIILAEHGYEVGLMAGRVERLEALQKEIQTNVHILKG